MKPLALAFLLATAGAYLAAPVRLPILIGFGRDGGVGPSTTVVDVVALAAADSVFAHTSNASYVANDRPGTATFDPANLEDLSRQARRDDAVCVRFTVRTTVGPWQCDFNDNPAVRIYPRERAGGGFGGRAQNVRAVFALPTRANAGDPVHMEWRWNGYDGVRSGARLFELDLIGLAGRQGIPTTLVDPAPFSTHPDSIAEGRRIANMRGILVDVGPNGVTRPIAASCNDCHIGGTDLRRFHYDEQAIASRGKLHGLTERQARNVASYYVSLTLAVPTDPSCRPWNPPFQPGPGLTTVSKWICGAGANAVLETDAQMAPFMYPTGYHPDSIRALYGGTPGNEHRLGIDRRTMPVPQQFPLWGGWIGRVSMIDMALDWNAQCQARDTFCWETGDLGRRDVASPETGPAWGRWADGFATPAQRDARIETQRRFFQGTSGGVTHEYYVRQNGLPGFPRKAEFTGVGFWPQIANQSFNQALAVRLFDVMTNRSTTSWGETAWQLANDLTCAVPNTPGYPYTWPGGAMLIGSAPGTGSGRTSCAETLGGTASQMDWTYFAVSPHIATRDGTNGPWDYPSDHVPGVGVANRNGADASLWYTLAQVLEAVVRTTAPGSPSDENYTTDHTAGTALPGRPASIHVQADGMSMLHRMQGPFALPRTEGNQKNWHLHHAAQLRFFYRQGQWEATAAILGTEAARGIMAGIAEAWLDQSERYPSSAWDAIRGTNYGDLDPRTSTFVAPPDPHPGEWMTPGNYLMHWTALLQELGARPRTVDRMARFGASLFDTPSGFAAFMCAVPGCAPEPPPPPPPPENTPPTVIITAPRQDARNVRNPVTVVVDATDRDGSVRFVRLFCDLDGDGDRELCATDTAAPWAMTVALPNRAHHAVHVEGEDDDGAVTPTPVRSFMMRFVRADR